LGWTHNDACISLSYYCSP